MSTLLAQISRSPTIFDVLNAKFSAAVVDGVVAIFNFHLKFLIQTKWKLRSCLQSFQFFCIMFEWYQIPALLYYEWKDYYHLLDGNIYVMGRRRFNTKMSIYFPSTFVRLNCVLMLFRLSHNFVLNIRQYPNNWIFYIIFAISAKMELIQHAQPNSLTLFSI